MKEILQPSKCLSLLPWESSTLKYGLLFVGIPFLALIIMVLFWPTKKEAEKKRYSAYTWLALIFGSSFTLFVDLALTLVVESTLGWGLALLTGTSVITGAISLVAGFLGVFTKTTTKTLVR